MTNAMRKIPVMLMVLMMFAFAAAPSWVAKGASLTYSVGSGNVVFKVTDVTSDDIKIEVTPSSTGKMSRATENRSADSGQFWHDSAKLASASAGSTVGDYTVKGTGTETFAGSQWNTITLEDTVSHAKTTKVYDKASGLLLKQTVDTEGVPVVTLVSFNIPGLAAADPTGGPPAPATPPAQGQQNNTSTSPGTGGAPEGNGTGPAVQPPAEGGSGQEEETGGQGTAPPPQEEEKGKCASGAILLALLGFAAFASAKSGVGRI